MPSKVQCWQLIDIPRPISSYRFYEDIWPSPNYTLTYAAANTALYAICFINSFRYIFGVIFYVQEDFFKVPHSHIKAPPGHLKGPLATSKWHALLVYSGCHHGKLKLMQNRSTTLIYLMWVTSFINYSCEKLYNYVDAMFPTLMVYITIMYAG